ncbi:Asp-tRNA(Asn)/Glu-tRNA(Gln) amidotransferase subunit GatB [bacterium]|nr:Asp-tRNA(Asn)/Glu-tRNA(Gln) amidotransferase subunit GatB [bacterium]
MTKYTPTIGIEIHVQLNTKTKMFCSCDNDSRTAEPNTNICPVCLAYPGTLPVVNGAAVRSAIKLGLALEAEIARDTKFDRKNYFYPDLPKGYQISQFDQPIVGEGYVEVLVDGEWQRIGVERAHLEEDAAKLIHPAGKDYSLVDYNRGGTPLIEIVSKPDIHSPSAAKRYLQEIYNIAMSLGITNGDMEHGNFKFDLNISVSDTDELGTKVELKNLNSFRNAERALSYEIARQTELLEKGEKIDQETRGWDDAKSKTFSQRGKEMAHDYRYFPEPDLPPLKITDEMIDEVRAVMPALPREVRKRLESIGIVVDDQDLLIDQPQTLQIFDDAADALEQPALIKKAVNWLVGDYQPLLARGPSKLTGAHLAELILLVDSGDISGKIAKDIFAEVVNGASPKSIVADKGLKQMSDTGELEAIVKDVLDKNPQAIADYKAGKAQALGFLVGQVMAATRGQANPGLVNKLLVQYLQA